MVCQRLPALLSITSCAEARAIMVHLSATSTAAALIVTEPQQGNLVDVRSYGFGPSARDLDATARLLLKSLIRDLWIQARP